MNETNLLFGMSRGADCLVGMSYMFNEFMSLFK